MIASGKIIGRLVVGCVLACTLALKLYAQNDLQFTGASATPENAILLYWASNTNEVYEIDYADSLVDTNTGTTTWNTLYTDYPSHGTNTFIADCGRYDLDPTVDHPKNSPMRFYRVSLTENNTSSSNPTIAIVSPTNGAVLSDEVTVQVSASSDEILSEVKLYVDGEEQWPTYDESNFVINTCEWLNGPHVLFATAKSQSGFEGAANGGIITYGRTASSYVNVSFNNLISHFDFSQPFFEPALGQTQQVTATFAANCNWTLQILDDSSNPVRTVTGSGDAMEFDWDGTGDGGVTIPDGAYTYSLFAQANGLASQSLALTSLPTMASLATTNNTQLLIEPSDGSGSAVPLALYPPGFNTNGYLIYEGSPSTDTHKSSALRSTTPSLTATTSLNAQPAGGSPGGSQHTKGPKRKPKSGNKGLAGTFGILYRDYNPGGFASAHPPTGWPYPLPTLVAIDGQTRTAQTVDYRILAYRKIAQDFAMILKQKGWKSVFAKRDDQWGDADIKKTSLGGNQIFDTVNFGLLMTHGSYGNDGSTGAEDDNIHYT